MNRIIQLLLLLCLAGSAGAVEKLPFEKEIVAFENKAKTNPPPQQAVLFTGSSTIRKWTTLAKDFPGHKVINRGFGGSQLRDSIYYFDRVILPLHPKMIVLYAGSNDINARKTPQTVVDDFKEFVRKMEDELPDTRLAYISINTCPSRWKDVEKVKQANEQIAALAKADPKLSFIDTFPGFLDKDGKPRPELFLKDRLHPNAQGYAIMTSIIGPFLGPAE